MDLRRTPFHARHVASGARMVPFAGFEMPVQYKGITAEHRAVRRGVGLFDVSHMGEVRVTGPNAAAALQWLLSNAILRLESGQAQYNVMCNEAGGCVDDVFVYKVAEHDFLVCVNASNRAKDFAWMCDHNPFPDGARFEDQGDAWAQVAIQGPRGPDLTARLTVADVRSLARHRFLFAEFAGVPECIVARTGYTGEDGFEVFVPADRAEPVWERILAAGADLGIEPIGLGARDTLRLEAGNVLYGHEIDEAISPLQARLGWIVKTRKPGGFLGSAALEARRDRTAIAPIVLEGKRIAREGMDVHRDGRIVGRVTSGTLAPFLERAIAFALLDVDCTTPGTRVVVDVRGKEGPAVVVEGPFYARP